MVNKGKECCAKQRSKENRDARQNLFRLLPLTGIAGLMCLAMMTVLIPACQEIHIDGDTSRDNRFPAALRG